MVDFKKKLKKKKIEKKIRPNEIYATLDRESDKGPLRPVQEKILHKWFEEFQGNKDVILKLHTGQGKTLTGLLMLQSKLNQDKGPALYLCHNNQLVEQTCQQAESFGINYSTVNGDIPDDFIDGKSILITSIQKLFNGETKFGLGAKSLPVSTILMDDAHACIEVIKNACKIQLKQGSNPYQEIFSLFSSELQNQGAGTYADITRKNYDALTAVPYWAWQDMHQEVSDILSKYNDQKEIRFTWPIIKDMIKYCQCFVSGTSLEIIPYVNPLYMFGSYHKADHRIFMSATITDDSFFIKGLGISSKTIRNPLCLEDEGWSGEKMILIPSLIDSSLTRPEVIKLFAPVNERRKFGAVALVPSFNSTTDWKKYGATVATKETIVGEIENLKDKQYSKTLVIANRYDGIDLPDNTCRVLILDSRPYFESLYDRYLEECRGSSEVISVRLAQTIEQGLGRAVRGEKDYCAIVITGTELVRAIRSKKSRENFSLQTRTQIELGLEIAEFTKEEIKEGADPKVELLNLLQQSIKRDEGWKEFYTENMDKMKAEKDVSKMLEILELEKRAEEQYSKGEYSKAVQTIQRLIDDHVTTDEERGWYLQEMARYIYPSSKVESNKYQIGAHRKNTFLFKPKEGMEIQKMSSISLKRIENIIKWIHSFDNFEDLHLELDDILTRLKFGVNSDRFEQAFDELAKVLGFQSQRPDKQWKEGPDNLWRLEDNAYLLVECKNNVDAERNEINKEETGQMNNACAWFEKINGSVPVKNIMIISTKNVARAAGFNKPVEIMRANKLKSLTQNVRNFYLEFKRLDLNNLSENRIQKLLITYKLTSADFLSDIYSEQPKHH
ncbi:TPA: DEAD/DEAH box helicase family protein [Bacillus cereus]|uniref:DEAD/DEAH box helicase n=1 Tax=Bacillus paranthracis TaxID=2026186 RepID=UPI001E3CF1D4|nr:DEAD/DEAH box helicase family protein [Bacillus paranthracis]MCC2375220.1 DEAD/DEAH box helicase family protein [Bacillus paranthracis]HDR6247080.1 DEAD/DEAH box helicase family protein [Bacillus cereus]